MGKGYGRTAHLHLFEESDSGIVPMNHSNKNGKLLAENENEKGRPLIKENTLQPNTCPNGGFLHRASSMLGRGSALPPLIRDRSRMR